MSDYTFEILAPAEIHKLVPLMEHCFGMKLNEEYFHWKFLQNPAGNLVAYVAKDNKGKIVAFEGMIPELYRFDGVLKTVFQSVDTMTHSDHRRKGLFRELSKRIYAHLSGKGELFIVGFGGKMSTNSLEKLGWKTVFSIPFLFKPAQRIRLTRSLSFASSIEKEYFVRKISDLKEIENLAGWKRSNSRIVKVIDAELIRWKMKNPRLSVEATGVFDISGTSLGYIIWYPENGKIMVLDCNFGDCPAVCEKILFGRLEEMVVNKKLKGMVSFAQEGTVFMKILRRNGFITNKLWFGPLREKLPFMYYSGNEDPEKYNSKEYWEIIPLYHDSF